MKSKLLKSILLLMVFAIGIQLQAQTQSPQKALSFNGVNQAVSGATGISTSLTAITIEAWVYHNTLPASVVQRYVTINPEVAVLRYDGSGGVNKLHFYIKKTNGSLYALQAENVLTTGTWMHVAGTYDGTTMKLYLNGNLLKSASPAGGLYPPSGSFSFSATGSEAFNGKMDEVSVWNSARTITDIREDMYRTAPIANANLKNYWQFNNGSGTTLSDMKGTATGTLQNTPTWVASTIPFAAGAVNTQIVNANGTKTLTGTGLVMNFTAKSGTDTIVASRIDTLANVSPTGVTTAFNSQYWVINRFGTGTFTTNATFTVNEDITSGQAAHPSLIQLYKRSGNGDGTWSLVATAASADAVNNTATFNGITSFDGQYMVCFSSPPNTVGTTLNFDGTNDYVDCGNASSLNITGAITIEAWINADTWNANSWGGTIVGKDNTSSSGFDLRCGNNGMLSFVIGSAGGWHEVLSGAVMSTGRWNYVAGVYDGASLSIYVNGVLAGQQSYSGAISVSALSLFIGNSPGFPTRVFDGKIDEVRLFNVARTEAQIRSDMCNTLTGTETGLVNYWQFNNGSGTTLTDVVASSNGTLTNMDAATCWVESYAMVVPAPAAATSITFTGFTANWTAPAIGTVTSYKLDVSTNTTFTAMVSGYNNVDCGNNLSKAVTGLTSGITYYYRVRADKTSLTGTGANYYTYTTVTTSCTPPTITSQSTATQTQPENCSFYPITVTATGTNVTYQWYSNTAASNSGGTSLGSDDGAQTSSYTPPGKAAGTLYYYCVVSGCATSQTSAVSGAFISTAVAAPAGSGTLADPYRIASLDNLCWLQAPENKASWTSNFIQTADINAAPCRNWNGGTGFSPIGYQTSNGTYYKFSGTYKGKGHTVDSIYIDGTTRPSVQGFFGYIINATIDSLSVTNVSILSRGYVGGLVGVAEAESNTTTTISYCSSSGSVTGLSNNNSRYGGLVGEVNNYNYTNGSNVLIKYCYSSAKVSSGPSYYQNLGGFAGLQSGHITQCYSTGLVITDNYLISNSGGGFVGYFNTQSGTIDSSYWDMETSGQTTGGKYTDTTHVHGRTTAQMKTQSTYTGWDFTNRWYISANANNGYPCFYYTPELSTQAVTNIKTFTATANGTIERRGTFNITSYGVCYNTTGTPTTADSKVNLGATSNFGAFTANMSGLHHGTTYYVRAFAINERDTVYGEQVSFTTTNVTQASTCINNGDQANYISVPNNSSLQLTNNYTIEVWIKPGVAVSTNRIIVSKGYNANGYTLLSNGSGNHRGLIFDGMATADNILTQNQWCHVAAVNNNGTRHLYLNGEEVALTGTPTSVTANTQPLYLSNYDNGGSSNCFRGYIEEVRLWNTAMSYSQVRENMHLPLTGSETGLVSYWQFDEGQPPTVYDKKGVNNGTWFASAFNQYIKSTIPFGSGYSNTQVVSTSGTTTFTNTSLAINFTTKSGSDIIVVTRIDSFPNVNPANVDTVFDRQYWTVHKYGLGDYTANLTFTINEDLTASDELQPGKIDLYTRTNATDDNWTYLASASSVSATNHQVTFNGLNNIVNPSENDPNSVKYLGQYIIVREQCQVNIPDTNFKTALLAIPGLDANSDGKIQCTEATAFTGDIDVNAKAIADMTGIEAFTHITKLFCSNNNLTSLNISALSLLTDLDCSNNQLTALNITSNTALINFSCANNSLTSLNVSGNTSLNYLVCRYNQLTSLDVSSNSALIGLYCNNNLLSSINVSGLTTLSMINCGVNQLTNLDFSSNTGITRLDCGYNSLTGLNVKNGHNTNISGAYFSATNNPGLICIQVDNAAWSTTNWTGKDAGASYSTDCSCINPAISSQSTATQTQCVNGTFTPITLTATGTNLMYQWYSNATASTSGGTTIGTNSNSYTPLATTVGTLYYYCEVSGDCGTLQTSAISGAFIVNPVTEISSQSTPAATQCLNGTFNAINVTATGLNITYQWYKNASASTTGGTSLGSANGASTNSYTPQATTVGTLYYYCVVTGSCGTPTSNISGAIVVNPATAINSQSTATQTQSLNGTFTPITVTATGTNLIYQWYSNVTASNTGGTSLGTGNGANTNSYTPQATTVGTLYYYCVVTGTCGTTQTTAVSGAFITSSSQTLAKQGAGVTLIIHGWNPDGSQPAWMQPMANAIIARSGGVGQIGTITVTGTKGNLTATCSNWNYNLATATSGEIVVLVNWTAVSNHLTTGITAQEVAAAIAPKIYQSQNAQPALSELPIHLMGHSRGGGMAYEIARLLGLQGIEVEQVTSLDPHPLTATDPQGAAVPIGPGSTIDTPIQIYQNILFADNYYQNIAYPTGLSLTGAYNRLWTSLPGGYHNQTGYTYNILGSNYNFSDHLNIILAYHGTIDLATPVSNGQATMTTTERTWFNTYENAGQNTGFVYSRDIAGNRKSTDIPNSGNAIIAGYNNNSTLGGTGARTTLTWTNAVWPNVITSVAVKNAVELSSGTQTIYNNDALQFNFTYRSYTNASAVNFYLDIDRNPYNNNNSATIGTQNFSSTASSIFQSTLAWTVSGLTSGTKYYVCAKINDATRARYQYLDYEFSMACIVNIPDTNFKAALLAISGLDANNNGNIECSEATAWTGYIDVSGKSISDLTGIASFTNITELNCGDNQLTSLNISSNTALIGLSCYGNNLTSLNVNSLTSLTGLSCSFNQLTSLDLSSNTELKNLSCGVNSITTLNVSANASLKSIYCDHNLLTSLNVQNGNNTYFDDFNATSNANLTCIQVDNVAWSTANWTHKDAGASYSTNCTPPCTNPAISSQSTATQTQCLNGTFTPITVTATGTNLIYQWYSNATATTTGGTTTGTNSNSYTPLATTEGTLYYYCEVNGDCGTTQTTAVSGAFIVNTIPDTPSNTTPLANQTINSGHSTVLSASGTGTLGWYSASTGGVWLGDGANLTTPVLTANTTYYVQDSTICGVSATRTAIAVEVVCIVNIPDTNFKASLLADSTINTNNDGEIQCSEATAYTGTINVDAKGIADLSGIEYFTNITNLICSNNSLNALNLSSNSLLTYIDCTFNQLTSLDVSSNTHLTNLQCGYNSLTSLNVSGLTSLNELACNANQLANLNLLSNTALTKLECSSNALTSLNVSGLILLVDLYCFNNQLTNLNVLANASIGVLECDQNLLTSLDVTGLTSLYYVTCYDNQLTTLDFSSNTSLRGLYCNDNLLTSLNVKNGNNTNFPYSDFDATNNPGLSCIQVDNAAYSTANWTQIDAGASFSTNCTPPCIVNIPDANFKAALLADATINTNSDGEIQCSEATAYTGTIDVAVKYISDITGIEAFTNLTQLYCGGNLFTSLDLSSNTALQYLDCNEGSITSLNISGLTALTYIDCYSNHFSSLNFSGIGLTSLTNVNCADNLLTSLNISGLTALTSLNCQYNQLSTLNVSTNTALQTLNCADNLLTSQNVSGLTALTSLDCQFNQLSTLDVSTNTALQTLNCYNNSLTSLNVSGLNNLIEINVGHNQLSTLNLTGLTSLNKIVVYYNQLTSINLNGFTSLAYIDCSNNQFSSLNFSGIGLTSLTEIYCNANLLTSINVSGLTSLNEIDCYNNQLTNLDFSSNTAIQYLYCNDNLLTSLNVKNGNNTIMSDFKATNNPNLSCIQVDNAAYSTANWTQIDAGASYSTNCACVSPAIISQSTSSQTQCLNGTFTPITVTAAGTNLMYQWYSNTTATTTGGTTTGTNSSSYTPLATTVGTLYYYCEVSGDCGTTQTTAISGAFIVNTIPNTPTNTTPLANQTINSGHSTVLSASGTGTLGWYSTSTGGVWLGGGANYTTPILNANTTYYVQDSTNCGASSSRTVIAVQVVCIVNIPDTNFKSQLLAISGLDTNNDGEIQCSEASAFTGVIHANIDGENVADMTGIEAFTNATELYCGGNTFTTLNLSSNTALQRLYCTNNSLTTLDLSSNTALEYIDCNSSSLTSLNVTGLTSLTYIDCSFNQLAGLNVSSNTALQTLDCKDNSLTSLNVSGLTALTSLYCQNNQLSTLNVSTNTALQYLDCQYNSLSSLNVLGLNNLIDINCDNNQLTSINLTSLTSLAYIDCSFNQFSSLNFSGIGLTSLTYIYCNANLLTSLNVSGLTSLYEIDCYSNQLTNLDFSTNTAIQYLYCMNNLLTSLNVKNGNNTIMADFSATNNPNLTCIQVDNAAYSTANWTQIDTGASYSTNCAILFTWIGNTSNAWSQGANWNTGTVPTSSDNIVIPSGTTYSPIVDLNTASAAVCNDLTINSAAVLTIAAAKALTVNGTLTNNAGTTGLVIKSDSTGTASLLHSTAAVNATVERYIPHSTADEFHMLASPVATQAISPVFNEPDGFYVWNEPNGNWIEYADVANFAAANGGTNFIPAKGYAVSYPGTTTKNFIGNLNQGIISIPLTVTTAIADSGWNFVANPYPSAIDWDATNGWTKSSLVDTNGTSINGKTAMWIWNSLKGNYGAYNSNNSGGIGTNGVSNNIAIGQGFWVKAATTGTLIMNDSVRVHSSQPYLKATSSDIIRLAVKGTVNNYSDEIVVKFGNTNDLEGAEKMFSLEATAPSLYSSKLNKKWSINYLTSITANSVIAVGFKAAIDGNYTINASELNSFSNLTYVYLKDLAKDIIIDLKQTATYTFASTTSDNPNRFQLLFALSPLGISDNVIQNTSIYANDNNIYINSNENILQIAVYNTIGQLIKTIENANNGNIVVNMADKSTAYYIVRVITGKNTYSQKVLIK